MTGSGWLQKQILRLIIPREIIRTPMILLLNILFYLQDKLQCNTSLQIFHKKETEAETTSFIFQDYIILYFIFNNNIYLIIYLIY